MKNFSKKVPEELWPEIKAEISLIRDASSHEQGNQLAAFI